MGFQCGIVGLPNVGKSTLFNALTRAQVSAENYPFCTIEPNVRSVKVPDQRLTQLESIVIPKPKKIVPTTLEIVDIAGLVKGAAQGEGLGNKFLAHIRETDAIAHVVRCFENKDITHVEEGKISPVRDIEIIQTELALADIEMLSNALLKLNKNSKTHDKETLLEINLFEKTLNYLNQGKMIRTMDLSSEEIFLLNRRLHLLTLKPTFYVANLDEDMDLNSPLFQEILEYAKQEGCSVVPVCASFEAELSQFEDEEREEFLKSLNLKEGGLEKFIRVGYELLNLITFFTAGPQEVHAWTITRGAKAPEAAGCIHTDFEKGFIRAEVTSFKDYVAYKGEQGAKEAGRLRAEGKDYIVEDGDVMHFLFNVNKK